MVELPMATCQYQSGDGRTCREATHPGSDTWCILHEPDPFKDHAAFLKALRERVDREEADGSVSEVDLAGVFFPPGFRWGDVRDKPLDKGVSFGGANFSGNASFEGATFTGDAYFTSATFTGDAYFRGATFSGVANFWNATFSGNASFWGAKFTGNAHFRNATFSGNADFGNTTFTADAKFMYARFESGLRFQGTGVPHGEGPGVVVFTNVTLERPDRVYFQDVDLSRASFRGSDLRQVRFINTTWAKRREKRWNFLWLRSVDLYVVYDDPRVSKGKLPRKLTTTRRRSSTVSSG